MRVADWISKMAFWVAYRTAPQPLGEMMAKSVTATLGVLERIQDGREGGVVIIGWSITPEGKELSELQADGCVALAREIRESFNKEREDDAAVS